MTPVRDGRRAGESNPPRTVTSAQLGRSIIKASSGSSSSGTSSMSSCISDSLRIAGSSVVDEDHRERHRRRAMVIGTRSRQRSRCGGRSSRHSLKRPCLREDGPGSHANGSSHLPFRRGRRMPVTSGRGLSTAHSDRRGAADRPNNGRKQRGEWLGGTRDGGAGGRSAGTAPGSGRSGVLVSGSVAPEVSPPAHVGHRSSPASWYAAVQ